jgi:hypothetical protein
MVKLPPLSDEVVQTSSETTCEGHVRSAVDECEKNTSTSLLWGCVYTSFNGQNWTSTLLSALASHLHVIFHWCFKKNSDQRGFPKAR